MQRGNQAKGPSTHAGACAVVTGASAGIGEEFALQLHARGASVILVARRWERIAERVRELNLIRKGSASFVAVDLAVDTNDEARAQGLTVRALSDDDVRPDGAPPPVWGCIDLATWMRQQRIDILVNNAGRGSFGNFHELPIEDEIQMIRLNIEATVRLFQAVAPQMKARGSGALFSLSSIAAFQSIPRMATYAATKAFNLHHTLAIGEELRPFSVKTLVVCPGPTATEFKGVARVPGSPEELWRDEVGDVVRQSLDALGTTRFIITTGARSWGISLISRFLPRALTLRIVGARTDKTLRMAGANYRESPGK